MKSSQQSELSSMDVPVNHRCALTVLKLGYTKLHSLVLARHISGPDESLRSSKQVIGDAQIIAGRARHRDMLGSACQFRKIGRRVRG